MKQILLSLFVVLSTITSAEAQTFEWGTPTWNIEDGTTFDGIDEFNANGLILTYPNDAGFYLTFLNVLAVDYDVYIDDDTTPVQYTSSAQASTIVNFNYTFAEGHKYRIVTTGAVLVQANLATYTTDTLTTNNDSYTISFTILGPELVKSYAVEGTQAISITDQSTDLTYSLLDTGDILTQLGIDSIQQATIYGLNVNGSYNANYIDPFDGWRDADGEYTTYYSGWSSILGHNAYPAVYCIKLSENADSVYYYFYDYWREYTGNDSTSVPATHAPTTSYNYILWEWDNGDGTTTTYRRQYRVDEGQDYYASFAIIANKKYVTVNATLHFVSQEAYAAWLDEQERETGVTAIQSSSDTRTIGIYSANGTRQDTLHKGINIIRLSDGTTKKIFVK